MHSVSAHFQKTTVNQVLQSNPNKRKPENDSIVNDARWLY